MIFTYSFILATFIPSEASLLTDVKLSEEDLLLFILSDDYWLFLYIKTFFLALLTSLKLGPSFYIYFSQLITFIPLSFLNTFLAQIWPI